jgi:hypothetical protein
VRDTWLGPNLYLGDGFEMKRKTAIAFLGFGDVFLAGGVVYDSRIEPQPQHYDVMPLRPEYGAGDYTSEPEPVKGDGFLLAAGVRSTIWRQDCLSVSAYGQLVFMRESCGTEYSYTWYDGPVYAEPDPAICPYPCPPPRTVTVDADVDFDSTELLVGVVGVYSGPRYSFYAGIEVFPYSDVSAEVTADSSDGTRTRDSFDMERDDSLTLLIGWQASFRHGYVTVESRSVGEKGLRVGLGASF